MFIANELERDENTQTEIQSTQENESQTTLVTNREKQNRRGKRKGSTGGPIERFLNTARQQNVETPVSARNRSLSKNRTPPSPSEEKEKKKKKGAKT